MGLILRSPYWWKLTLELTFHLIKGVQCFLSNSSQKSLSFISFCLVLERKINERKLVSLSRFSLYLFFLFPWGRMLLFSSWSQREWYVILFLLIKLHSFLLSILFLSFSSSILLWVLWLLYLRRWFILVRLESLPFQESMSYCRIIVQRNHC